MIPRFALAIVDEPSVTVAANENVPTAIGVPEISPFVLSDNPSGSAPAVTDHVYGGVPPLAARLCE